MHIVVTAAALIATVYAWSAVSDTEQPSVAQASTERDASPSVAAQPSLPIVVEDASPAPAQTVLASTPPSLSEERAPVPAPLPQMKPLLIEQVQPASVAEARRPAQVRRTHKARSTRTHAAHHVRHNTHKSRAVIARAGRNHGRGSHQVRNRVATDPYDCRVRKNKPPCFHAAGSTSTAQR
ncbi:MAG: hypothetical protein GC190_17530 [Alphaproteobacteria bacterium]|nr:hypothetical protein [Alphaproteobacteria bacterium]